MMNAQPLTIFVHIPKTAGMSFSAVITRQFKRDSVYNLNATLSSGIAALSALPAERRAKIRLLYGHLTFGLHAAFGAPASYITFLRNPAERIVSTYYYALRRPELGFHRKIVDGNLSLHDFVTSAISAEIHDAQTAILSGSDVPVSGADALARACANMEEHFRFVGLTERFDESLMMCRRIFGWRNVHYQKINVNRRRVRLSEVGRATIAEIERRNSLDCELYETVRRDFERRLAETPGIEDEVRRFRRINALYSSAMRTASLPISVVRDFQAATARAR